MGKGVVLEGIQIVLLAIWISADVFFAGAEILDPTRHIHHYWKDAGMNSMTLEKKWHEVSKHLTIGEYICGDMSEKAKQVLRESESSQKLKELPNDLRDEAREAVERELDELESED